MIFDFHNHFFPKPYLDALRGDEAQAAVTTNAAGETIMVTEGDYNIILPEHFDPAARVAALEAAGVDGQCLTMTVPGVHLETAVVGTKLAQVVNDGFAEVIAAYPSQFTALAALPLQAPATAAVELRRAVEQGNLRGGVLFSNVNGERLDDPKFWPIFETAVSLDVPLFIHPFIPPHIGALRDYRLVAVEGFLFDTSIAASRLIYSGVCERFPTLQLVLAHMGGTLPFLAERLDRGFEVYPECREHISEPPSHALRRMYSDTFPHAQEAVRFTVEFSGADKVLMGSDYPHQIGDLAGGVQTIRDLPLNEEEKGLILGGNARRLLKLD